MIFSTTPSVGGRLITEHLGILVVEVTWKGFRTNTEDMREEALQKIEVLAEAMGADAVVGLRFDNTTFSVGDSTVLMVAVSVTAVKLEE